MGSEMCIRDSTKGAAFWLQAAVTSWIAWMSGSAPRKPAFCGALRRKMPNPLDLVEPTRAGRRKGKGHVRMPGEPVAVFLGDVHVVPNDGDLPVKGLVRYDLIHKGLEVDALLGRRRLPRECARGGLQSGEQVDRVVSLVEAFQTLDDLATAGLRLAAGTLFRA